MASPCRRREVLDLLAGLVDKSILLTEPGTGPVRFRMPETIRAFGLEQLAVAGDEILLRRRHRDHFARIYLANEPWFGPRQRELISGDAARARQLPRRAELLPRPPRRGSGERHPHGRRRRRRVHGSRLPERGSALDAPRSRGRGRAVAGAGADVEGRRLARPQPGRPRRRRATPRGVPRAGRADRGRPEGRHRDGVPRHGGDDAGRRTGRAPPVRGGARTDATRARPPGRRDGRDAAGLCLLPARGRGRRREAVRGSGRHERRARRGLAQGRSLGRSQHHPVATGPDRSGRRSRGRGPSHPGVVRERRGHRAVLGDPGVDRRHRRWAPAGRPPARGRRPDLARDRRLAVPLPARLPGRDRTNGTPGPGRARIRDGAPERARARRRGQRRVRARRVGARDRGRPPHR